MNRCCYISRIIASISLNFRSNNCGFVEVLVAVRNLNSHEIISDVEVDKLFF